jgi:AraC-like DNA-binding protein
VKGVPLFRASALIPFARFLERLGAPVHRLLAHARLPAAVLERPDTLFPAHQSCLFFEEASRREGIPHLGSHVAEGMPIEALGTYGRLVTSSATLQEALDTIIRLHGLYASGGRLWLADDGDRLWLRYGQDRRLQVGWRHGEEFSLGLMLNLLRLTGEEAPIAIDVDLRAPQSDELRKLEPFANARVRFEQASTGVAIPRAWLARPLRRKRAQDGAPAPLIERLAAGRPSSDFPGSMRQAIATFLLEGYPDVRRSADAIGMSVRTLQRRLSESGLSYSRLVEQERFRSAVSMLADPNVKVTDVAIELGYADLANFTHAFHRWTGASPSVYRFAR